MERGAAIAAVSDQGTGDSKAMAEESEQIVQVRTILKELAYLARDVLDLDPAAREALASLLEELSARLEPNAPSDTEPLGAAARRLVRTLGPGREHGLLESIEEAAARAESEAPMATLFAQRLIDTLASLGI
jgi:hypothetical protein